jgi:signal transduction histidine kinase
LIVLPDLQAMPGLVNAELYRHYDIRTTVLARLIRGSDLVGLLNIHMVHQARDFDQSELDLLTAIADQGAQAIANARLLLETRQQREQLRALSARLAAAEEAERRRLARELHDQVGQSLTALSINLNLVRSQLPDTSIKEKQRLDDSLKLVEETAEHIRDVMAELRPAVLDDYGLLAALRWQGERISRFAAVDIVVEGAELSPRLPQAIETALFRIAQEALTNMTRHAQASQARITLEGAAGMARLTLADNGIGFDPERPEAGERPRWGLLTMRERIEAVGGRLRVESAPGRGTRVMVEAPLNLPELESR